MNGPVDIPGPNKVWISLTNRCNLTCPHCAPDSRKPLADEFSTQELIAITNDALDLGAKRIAFTGGEPTLRRELIDLVTLAASRGARVYVESNGTSLVKSNLSRLKAAGVAVLNLSLDGVTAAIHDTFRGRKGNYDAVIRNVNEALELGIDVRVYCTVTNKSLSTAEELIDLFMALPRRINVLTYAYFVPVGRGSRNRELAVPPQDWMAFCQRVEHRRLAVEAGEWKIRYEPAFVYESDLRLMKDALGYDIGCIARGRDYMYVGPSGEVYGCIVTFGTAASLGNVRRMSLRDIWLRSDNWQFFERATTCKGCPALALYAGSDLDPRHDGAKSAVAICPMTQFPKVESWVYDNERKSALQQPPK